MRHVFTLFVILSCCRPLFATCAATTFTPQRNQGCQGGFQTTPATHQALSLTDPAGEQTATIDLEWGGVLVSLKYLGKEHFWGHDTGATVQPAMHHGATYGYNPQQSGDNGEMTTPYNWNRGAPVYGATCKTADMIVVYSTALDDGYNNRGFYGRAAGIRNEQVAPVMWAPPYAFTTYLKFVPSGNPAGVGPRYYLKLDQAVINTDATEGANQQGVFGFSFEMAMYMPGTSKGTVPGNWTPQCTINVDDVGAFRFHDFLVGSCPALPCPAQPAYTLTKMLTGAYTDSARTEGVAVSVNPSLYFGSESMAITGINFDNFWNETSVHSGVNYFVIPPLQGKRYSYYFLAGPSARAKAFNPQ